MSARVFVCESCGCAAFPERLLCASCGSRDFRQEAVEHGILEQLADRGNVKIGLVRVAQGPLLVARVEGDPERGGRVELDEEGDLPVARA